MEEHAGLKKGAQIIEEEAKRVLGTYDYGWPPLAASTIEHKQTGDSPGLETGDMRDSIAHTISGKEAHIGTDEDKAVWFELGTVHQPPRSFLREAAVRKTDEVVKEIGYEIIFDLRTIHRLSHRD